MEPEFKSPSSGDVEAMPEGILDDKNRRVMKMKEVMQMIMANQEKTDKRIMELSDFCKELDEKLREQKWHFSKTSIIFNNLLWDPKDV